MDLRKVKRFIELAEANSLAELEVSSRRGSGEERLDEHVRIVRVPRPSTSGLPAPADALAQTTEQAPVAPGHVVAAPMSGTFYRAPAPGETPFIEAGDTVAVGDVLCIVESMKMMNQIESEVAGRVAAVLVADGVPIETGAPLFRIT
ncbi:MAG: acetyl-CoA carboxylase biotin carboxyl carrier protein [Gammaproteobacteria bacterium]|nr:acetyl-CoA carboxylase biotin carboxyl carrier protein [Gammaproteobacteria bacterium]